MKIRHPVLSLLLPSLLAVVPIRAQTSPIPPAGPAAAEAPRELVIVVVESIERHESRFDTFNRIDRVFTDTIKKKKWPVKVTVDRFAGNLPAHDLELRIFYKGLYEETPGDLTFHAWVTFEDHGAKHDFGMIKYRSYPRAAQPREDALDDVVRGAALATLAKLEPLLFPDKGGTGG